MDLFVIKDKRDNSIVMYYGNKMYAKYHRNMLNEIYGEGVFFISKGPDHRLYVK